MLHVGVYSLSIPMCVSLELRLQGYCADRLPIKYKQNSLDEKIGTERNINTTPLQLIFSDTSKQLSIFLFFVFIIRNRVLTF